VLPAAVTEDLVDAVDGFCDAVGFTHAQIARLFSTARAHGLPVKLHADQYSNFKAGQLAAEYGAMSAEHLEYADEETIAALAAAGTVAVLLPGANYTLQDPQKPPVALLRKHGVPMALATNCNPSSSPTTMPTMIMNLACHLFRLTPEEAVCGFTTAGSRALRLETEYGTLEVRKAADLAVWEVETWRSYLHDRSNPCLMTVKAGTIMYQRHRRSIPRQLAAMKLEPVMQVTSSMPASPHGFSPGSTRTVPGRACCKTSPHRYLNPPGDPCWLALPAALCRRPVSAKTTPGDGQPGRHY
jgi:imidazolonepropionase